MSEKLTSKELVEELEDACSLVFTVQISLYSLSTLSRYYFEKIKPADYTEEVGYGLVQILEMIEDKADLAQQILEVLPYHVKEILGVQHEAS